MWLAAIFVVGLAIGFLAHRYDFCIFGALVDWFGERNPTRVFSVLSAVLVFSLVHIAGYRHDTEYPGLIFLLGGSIQAFGYALARGCPLGLLVRLGEGSLFHVAVFVGFLAGAGLYVGLMQPLVTVLLDPIQLSRMVSFLDLWQ